MPTKLKHSSSYSMYFCTFTCFQWIDLFKITNSYDCVYKWFEYLHKKKIDVVCYIIMPNHLHCILYFPNEEFDLNKIVSNAKRFMAYEIIKRLESSKQTDLLGQLAVGVSLRESKKGQKHKVFEESFDAKPIYSHAFLVQKLEYIHHNPTRGKWNLATDFVSYEHSSAAFYEMGKSKHFKPTHYMDVGGL